MSYRFSIIVPTCGRASLEQTLASIRAQKLQDGDEVLVVSDGPQPHAAALFHAAGVPGRMEETAPSRDYGGSQRNRAMDLATGDYLLFMDDDDVFVPGAFAHIRAVLREAPGLPHLFRMRYAADGRVLWGQRVLALGNLSTQMIVFPNHPGLWRWDNRHGHDYRFVVNNLALWPAGSLVWREEIIAVIRPHDGPFAGDPLPPSAQVAPRPVEQCPYRAAGEPTRCRLLQQVSGVAEEMCTVQRDACEACCAAFPPTVAHLNPVVAALLYELADSVAARGGVPGCDAARAVGLRARAEQGLELELPAGDVTPRPRRASAPCCYIGAEVGFRLQSSAAGHVREPVLACRHPDHRETTAAACESCRDWADQPGPAPLPIAQLVPPSPCRHGPRIRRWAVGVTTAPRRQPTLDSTLASLARAGWESPRLFVDEAVTISTRFADLPVTLHDRRLGAWPNYYLALTELLLRHPDADALLLVQDDVLFDDRHNLRAYLEEALWPGPPGLASLYCSRAYTQPTCGWHEYPESWVWGALAFVFTPEAAKRFVLDPHVLDHRWAGGTKGLTNIDCVIGGWAVRHGIKVYFPTPSLVQHLGDTSTLWPDSRAAGERRAAHLWRTQPTATGYWLWHGTNSSTVGSAARKRSSDASAFTTTRLCRCCCKADIISGSSAARKTRTSSRCR